MPLGKRPRKQNRIRLRKIRQRIGDLGLRLVEFILPQLLVPGRIHAQDQQISFILESRMHDRFNHRLGQLHSRRGPHGVERFFREAGLAGRNFKCGFARQPLDGQRQRIQQRRVRRADREKYSHAESNAQRCHRNPKPVCAPLARRHLPQRANHALSLAGPRPQATSSTILPSCRVTIRLQNSAACALWVTISSVLWYSC